MRLGREKALELVRNQRLIDRVVISLKKVCQNIFVVTSQEQIDKIIFNQSDEIKTVIDLYPGKSALGGIYTGLYYSNNFLNFIVACDMPFLNHNLLKYMIEVVPGFDAVVPKIDKMVEPLHALYSRNCLDTIKTLIDNDDLTVSNILQKIKTKYVKKEEIIRFDPELLSFFNINTRDDLLKAEGLIINAEGKITR